MQWEQTIRSITSSSLQCPRTLGPYLCPPHIPFSWFSSNDNSLLYHAFSNEGYNVYQRCYVSVTTRSGPRFNKISTLPGNPPMSTYASVVNYSSNHVNLHSTAPAFNPAANPPSFLSTLLSNSDPSLWSNLQIDGDGSWLIDAINNESLDICNDGSYMPDLSRSACSGAFILRCRESNREIKGCFTDNSHGADNYRGELLGSLGPLILLRAAFLSCPDSSVREDASVSTIRLHCDNRGVVLHGNDPHSPLKDGQKQADLVRLLKSYSRLIPCNIEWVHIKGHSDRHTAFNDLSPLQQLNVRCDKLAKSTLQHSISNNTFMSPTFPDEDIVVAVNSLKARSSIKSSIYRHWGKVTARDLFSRRYKICPDAFDLVYWDCMGKVMSDFPKTFQDWVTRHISDFNGCNRYLSRFTPTENVCPSCGRENEDTAHVTRCPDPTRTTLYNDDVSHLKSWLISNHTPQELADLISSYLLHRGSRLMSSLTHSTSPFYEFASTQDRLGFDNLIVGRLPRPLIQVMTPILAKLNRRGLSPDLWARKLSRELLLFTHKQWTYRNTVKHYKPSEGKTVAEHNHIDLQVQSLLSLSPSRLLPQHRHLLSDQTAASLATSTSTNKQFWIADLQSALDETALVLRLKRKCHLPTQSIIHNSQTQTTVANINSPLFPSKHRASKPSNGKRRKLT